MNGWAEGDVALYELVVGTGRLEWRNLAGWVRGVWGITHHPEDRSLRWNLTHRPTGLTGGRFRGRRDAAACAEALDGLPVPWAAITAKNALTVLRPHREVIKEVRARHGWHAPPGALTVADAAVLGDPS